MKLQLNVTEIENGFLVGLPPNQQSPNGVLYHCNDLDEVSNHILNIAKTRSESAPKGDNIVGIN